MVTMARAVGLGGWLALRALTVMATVPMEAPEPAVAPSWTR